MSYRSAYQITHSKLNVTYYLSHGSHILHTINTLYILHMVSLSYPILHYFFHRGNVVCAGLKPTDAVCIDTKDSEHSWL